MINTITHTIELLKIKPIDVKSDSYAECNVDSNEKYPQFKDGDQVIISKHENIFAKVYAKS